MLRRALLPATLIAMSIPAHAAPPGGLMLDQAQTLTSNFSASVGLLGLARQQEVVAGTTGRLAGIELFVGTNDQAGQGFQLNLRRGPGWQESAPLLATEVVPPVGDPVGWVFVDLSAAAIDLTAGETFVIEVVGTGLPGNLNLQGDQATTYPAGSLFQRYLTLSPIQLPGDLAFRTWLASPATPPVADAGPDQVAWRGALVTLDGTGSYADDTSELTFTWDFASTPAGSAAALEDADTANPWFVVDALGDYLARLVVTDPASGLSSEPAFVLVSSENLPPVAHVEAPSTVFAGEVATIDATASHDPDGDSITLTWALVARPDGSAATLDGVGTNFALATDRPGTYVVTLTVSDGDDDATAEVTIVASSARAVATASVVDAVVQIARLPRGDLPTLGHRVALTVWLLQAAIAIVRGDADQATDALDRALERADGCALRGRPDGRGPRLDWVVACDAQAPLHAALSQALAALAWLE